MIRETLPQRLKQMQRNASIYLNIKLEYNDEYGIEQFLSFIENCAHANDIYSDERKVNLALTALDKSKYGLILQNSLDESERKVWSVFKSKLTKILGKNRTYYKNKFLNFKRGDLTPGLALAILIHYFRSKSKTKIDQLSDKDAEEILSQYCQSFEQPIKSILISELHSEKLTLSNADERASALETAYTDNTNLKASSINVIERQAIEKGVSDMTEDIRALMNSITKIKKDFERFRFGKKKLKKKLTLNDKLQGHCMRHMFETCNNQNCGFKHVTFSLIPDSVKEWGKKYYRKQ